MRYTLDKRALELGGGWQAIVYNDQDQDIARCVVPLAVYADSADPESAAYADALEWAEEELYWLNNRA